MITHCRCVDWVQKVVSLAFVLQPWFVMLECKCASTIVRLPRTGSGSSARMACKQFRQMPNATRWESVVHDQSSLVLSYPRLSSSFSSSCSTIQSSCRLSPCFQHLFSLNETAQGNVISQIMAFLCRGVGQSGHQIGEHVPA